MQLGRLQVHDGLGSVGGRAASLFDDKGQGRGFVQEAQLAVRRLAVAGVEEDAALEQVAVEVGHERADVARRVGLRTFFELIDVVAHRRIPPGIIALVGAVVLTFPGDFDVLVGEQKFAEAWVEGKAVAAAAGGIDQHGAGAVDDVAGRRLARGRSGGSLRGLRRRCFFLR